MTVLEQVRGSNTAAEAAFLLPSSFFEYSQSFWLRHADLLPYDYGLIYQGGSSVDASRHQSLQFDASARGAGRYIWQITEPHRAGRTIDRLTVGCLSTLWQRFEIDEQGVLTGTFDVAPMDVEVFQFHVKQLLSTDIFSNAVTELRAKKKREERDLSEYLIREPYRHNKIPVSATGWTERENKERHVEGIGFSALNLYIPSSNR